MANYIVNELFSYTDLDLEAYGGVIEEGFEHVTRAPVLEAIRIATKIVSDPTAAQLVYGDVGKQFHGTINAADIMRVLTVVCERKLLLAVQDSENMGHAYVQCLAYPNITAKQLTMPVLFFNEKYTKSTLKCTSWFASCCIKSAMHCLPVYCNCLLTITHALS